MIKKRKAAAWAAVVLAGILTAGCSVLRDEKDQSQETAQETDQETQPPSSAAQEPETSHPETISPFPETEPQEQESALEDGSRIIFMSDMHYLAEDLRDGGEAFQAMIDHGDGKLVNYVTEILSAAFDEVIRQNADVLILGGDLTLEGEKESHQELAKMLERVEDAGIPVVVIPGNHDINNPRARGYSGNEIYPAENITADEFEDIYWDYGYEESISRDSYSLSYTYQLNDHIRLLLLDSCQYEPRNQIGGMIKTETYDWIRRQIKEAREDNMIVLPVSHHNLLDQSKIYVGDCTIEHSESLIDLLEDENIPIYLSGHLHVQHYLQHDDIGIYEVVTSSLATPPCQYGVLEYMWNGSSFRYYTCQTDVEAWARRNNSEDENLLNFSAYSPPTLNRIFYNQAYDAMKDSREEEKGDLFVPLTEEQKQKMSMVYADMNAACYAGTAVKIVDQIKDTEGYSMWQEFCYPSIPYEYLEYIIEDAVKDYNYLESD